MSFSTQKRKKSNYSFENSRGNSNFYFTKKKKHFNVKRFFLIRSLFISLVIFIMVGTRVQAHTYMRICVFIHKMKIHREFSCNAMYESFVCTHKYRFQQNSSALFLYPNLHLCVHPIFIVYTQKCFVCCFFSSFFFIRNVPCSFCNMKQKPFVIEHSIDQPNFQIKIP